MPKQQPEEQQDQSAPIADEATSPETVRVEWEGLSFDVPRWREDWDYETVLALEERRTASAMRGLMPEAAFREFMARRPKQREADELFGAIVKALGN